MEILVCQVYHLFQVCSTLFHVGRGAPCSRWFRCSDNLITNNLVLLIDHR